MAMAMADMKGMGAAAVAGVDAAPVLELADMFSILWWPR